jgi:hypothetical protein
MCASFPSFRTDLRAVGALRGEGPRQLKRTTTMTVEFERGHRYLVPLVLRDDQTLTASAAFGDQMLGMVDMTHDVHHPECAGEVAAGGRR